MYTSLYGIQKLVDNELVFFYMIELEYKNWFSHEYGREQWIENKLDGFLQYKCDKPTDNIEKFFADNYDILEKEIIDNYEKGLLIVKKVL